MAAIEDFMLSPGWHILGSRRIYAIWENSICRERVKKSMLMKVAFTRTIPKQTLILFVFIVIMLKELQTGEKLQSNMMAIEDSILSPG